MEKSQIIAILRFEKSVSKGSGNQLHKEIPQFWAST